MNLSKHDMAMLQDLRTQSAGLILFYGVVGIVGLLVAVLVEFAPQLRVIVAFLSGGLVGISIEKLVSRRIRSLAYQLWQRSHEPTP